MILLKDYQKEQNSFFLELSEKLPAEEVDAWVTSLRIEAISKEEVVLSGLNQFFGNHVQENHKDILKDLLYKHFSSILEQNFSLVLKIRKSPRKNFQINDSSLAQLEQSHLALNHSFETFVNGSNTQIAYAAAAAVASDINSTKYNPLFICGDVGLGKTHLMQAIGHDVLHNNPEKIILYCTSEQFTNDLIQSIRTDKTEKNREKYRSLDLLLIDDIHFLEGKESVQEELFHTFNELITRNKQVVFTADKYPRELKNIEERLISRFSAGMVAKIEPPDFETRIAIVRDTLNHMSIFIDDEVIEHIAHSIKSNVRELKGVLVKLGGEYSLLNQKITLESARLILKDVLNLDKSPKNIDEIITFISKNMHIKVSDILSEKRDRNISMARQIAMYVSREVTDSSYPVIGRKFEKNHTSVLQSCKKIKLLIEEQPELRQMVTGFIRELTV